MGFEDNECAEESLRKTTSDNQHPEFLDTKILPSPSHQEESHALQNLDVRRCIFCGMGVNLNLGQGELLRIYTKIDYSEPPTWYSEFIKKVKVKQEKCTDILATNRSTHTNRRNQHSKVVIASFTPLVTDSESCKVGPHVSLDGCRRNRNKNFFGYDCKPCLAGMPNAYFDCNGRPFGLVEELNYIGWPSTVGEDTLKVCNLLVKCTPREGEEGGWIYAHHCCASWSNGVHFNDQMVLEGVEEAAVVAISRKCSFCLRYGASISCRVSGCDSCFHFLCASGAGCLQDIETLELLCPVHISEALTSNRISIHCALCESFGDLAELLFCTSCGSHYHASCLEPPLQPNPTIRIGWQCAECKTCLICNESKDENKMLVCDVCDKGYHTYCLKPPVSCIPKNGFRCERCRVCSDCGGGRSSTLSGLEGPVAFNNQLNPNVRWHSNYTLCDRCFHAHKRPNSCCPVCERAWRCSLPIPENSYRNPNSTFLVWPGNRCNQCRRMVHAECDPSCNQTTVSPSSAASEETGGIGSANYVCPVCRARGSTTPSEAASTTASLRASPIPGGGNSSHSGGDIMDDNFTQGSRDLLDDTVRQCMASGSLVCPGANGSTSANTPSSSTSNSTTPNTEPGKQQIQLNNQDYPGSPRSHCKVTCNNSKLQLTNSTISRSTPDQPSNSGRRRGSNQTIDPNFTKTNSTTRSSNVNIQTSSVGTTKTGALKRTNSCATSNNINKSRRTKSRKITTYESKVSEEKDDHPSTVVFCRSDDKFMLEQDICIACGSIGLDTPLLACSQCGQCYHSFCAEVPKITRTMIEKGWRCLDCTVCEGCGGTSNESLLLLCDDCNISFHTYCLDPPLKEVPKGGWKCADCVVCTNCGQRDPGLNGKWHANYSLCAPCASLSTCPVCNLAYREEELLVRCALCIRWAHANCDQLRTEDELELATDLGYNCLLCRELGADIGTGHAQVLAYRQAANGNLGALESLKFGEITEKLFADKLPSSLFPYSSTGVTCLARSAHADDDNSSSSDTRQFFMDGIVLSECGLNTIKQALLKFQPKRHANQRRFSDQNQSITDTGSCSVGDSTPVELTPCGPHGQFDEDTSQHSGVDGENDLSSYTDWKSPSLQSEEDGCSSVQDGTRNSLYMSRNGSTGSVSANGKTSIHNSNRNRPLKHLGIGGFRAKPNRWLQTKKMQLATASDPFTGPPTSDSKRRRQNKRKSELEDNYPDYLMKAFYGANLLSVKRKPFRRKKIRIRPVSSSHGSVFGSESISGMKQNKGEFSPLIRSSKVTKGGIQMKKSTIARLGSRPKSDDSGLDIEWAESRSKDEEFETAAKEIDEDDDLDDGDEEYEDDDDIDGDLCDFDELKDLEDEMDNEALDNEEDLSATLNPAAHQLTERVSEIKMTDNSTDSDMLRIKKDNIENGNVDESVSRDSSSVDYSNSHQGVSSRSYLSVNSTSQDTCCLTSTGVSQLSPKSQSLVTSLDPDVDAASVQASRITSVVHSSHKESSAHVDLLSVHSPQRQSAELSVTTTLAGQNVSLVTQATTPAGLNEAADLMFMDDYLFGFGDLASTDETDLNDITPQQVTSDHVTNQLQTPCSLPVGHSSKNHLKQSVPNESPAHVSFIYPQDKQNSQSSERFGISEKVVYQSQISESLRMRETPNSEGTCLKQFVAQQDLISSPFDSQSQQTHLVSANKPDYQKSPYLGHSSSNYIQIIEDQHPHNVQHIVHPESQQSHLVIEERQALTTGTQSVRNSSETSLNQLVDSVDVCPPHNTIIGAYELSSRDTPNDNNLGPSRNLPGHHPRHCVNTLPELSVTDIETQLGPSTGFELSEPNLADDSPKLLIPNAVFSNDLSTTPPPSEISIQRIPQHQQQQRQNIIHSNPDSVRQSYSQRPMDQCREHRESSQPINVQQHQIPRSPLLTVPISQTQVRPMQQQHIDPQGGRVQIRGSQPSYFYAHVVPVSGRVLAQPQKQQHQLQRQSSSPIVLQSPVPPSAQLSVVGGHGKFIPQPLQPKSPNPMTPPPPPPYPSQVMRPGLWPQQQQQPHPRLITSSQGAIMLSAAGQCLVPQASNSAQLLMSSPQSNVPVDTQHLFPVCCQQNTPVEYLQRSCVSHPIHSSNGPQRTPPTQQMIVHGQGGLHSQPVQVYQAEHITSPNSRQFAGHPNSLSPGILRFNSGSEEVILRCSSELQNPSSVINPNSMKSPGMEGNSHHVVLNRPNQQNILPCTVSNNTQLCITNSNPNVSNSASRRINYHKWEEDERLGGQSTIAPVLHANVSHPTLRGQYPEFTVRAKEISKLWRRLSSEERGTWVIQARNNRTTLRSNQTNLPTTMGLGGMANTMSPTQPYCQSSTLTNQTVPLQSASDLSYPLESPTPYSHPQNRTPHHMQLEQQINTHSPQQTKELHRSLTPETPNSNYTQDHILPSHMALNGNSGDSVVAHRQVMNKPSSSQSLAFSNTELNTSGNFLPQHQQVMGLTTPSPGSSYITSPVNSRPPSRHQTSLPPPPPIWPPSGNMNTGSVGVNSPVNLKQPTPPPSVCSSVSPAPIRSPASAHAPTPTSFHVPHPYPSQHGASSLTSPAQSPAPPQSPSNTNQLLRSNSNTGIVTQMPSTLASPVSQSHHTVLSSNHHLNFQNSTTSESPVTRPQNNSFVASHPATPGTPNNQLCGHGNTLSAPATPGAGMSPGNIGMLCHSAPTNPGSVFILGSSGIHVSRMSSESDVSQSISSVNMLPQSSSNEHVSSSIPIAIEQVSSVNSYTSSQPQSHAQQASYSNTELERQRLKEILAKQVHQRQVQHQHHQQLMQQQQQQQFHLAQQEQEHVMSHHPLSQSTIGQQGGSCSALVYTSMNQSGGNLVHQQPSESHCQPYGNYINTSMWQQHASIHDPYHSISPQNQVHHQQPTRHAYFSQHTPMFYQQSQSRPAPISPSGSRILTSIPPGTPINLHPSSQFISSANPSAQGEYTSPQNTSIQKAIRLTYPEVSELVHQPQIVADPSPSYGISNQNMMSTSRSNQQMIHSNTMQVFRSNVSQRSDLVRFYNLLFKNAFFYIGLLLSTLYKYHKVHSLTLNSGR
ncbi:Histone-lysine N-methyltransferase 2C [Schistosoma japonicum]|uniref:Histone-lysine N-methyltransferase 2C n=1 Tax=Schistosoma japonicum TaxID=6182 RepID=A0A4Z2DDF5_SCHJA|nr:Histone-lysine N-methyltransferase 2C [Schistosoma japonicum]